MSDRISVKFAQLKAQKRSAFVAFISAGDPDYDQSMAIFKGLPDNGVDIIELGMPFSDPMADGPAIQLSSKRALQSGQNMIKTLKMVREFRKINDTTPIVLMGYFNPIYAYGVERFLHDIKQAGVDGIIVVDLPPEEDDDCAIPAQNHGIHFIRLLSPTSHNERLPKILERGSGFVYYISVLGVTGSRDISFDDVSRNIARIRKVTKLPIVVGFGITTAEQAHEIGNIADGAVVGSAIVREITTQIANGASSEQLVKATLARVQSISRGIHR